MQLDAFDRFVVTSYSFEFSCDVNKFLKLLNIVSQTLCVLGSSFAFSQWEKESLIFWTISSWNSFLHIHSNTCAIFQSDQSVWRSSANSGPIVRWLSSAKYRSPYKCTMPRNIDPLNVLHPQEYMSPHISTTSRSTYPLTYAPLLGRQVLLIFVSL